jgi:hypothetical protein
MGRRKVWGRGMRKRDTRRRATGWQRGKGSVKVIFAKIKIKIFIHASAKAANF